MKIAKGLGLAAIALCGSSLCLAKDQRYDLQFRWDDQRMYCSELVWKIYEKAGVRLCEPSRFRDYILDRPSVRKFIDERYGGSAKFPMDEQVVAPSNLAASKMLEEPPRK
jgi:hypothetical protein